MSNRIPPKGTKGYRRYYRDKDLIEQAKTIRSVALVAKDDSTQGSPQREHYANAVMLMDQVITHLHSGWLQEYVP